MFDIFKAKKLTSDPIDLPTEGICAITSHEFFVPTAEDMLVLNKVLSNRLRKSVSDYLDTKGLDSLVVVNEPDMGNFKIMTKEDFIKTYKILEENT